MNAVDSASAIAMLEIGVEIATRCLGWSRVRSSVTLSLGCFIVGLGSVFSFNRWSHWHPLSDIPLFFSATLFDLLDYVTSNLMLPVAGFGLALFAGWAVPVEQWASELGLSEIPAAILAAALIP
jgi:NSS family neurotransmitter:Na+ symporter